MTFLGLSKDSELHRIITEFEDREDADEICEQSKKDVKEEYYAGESAHIKHMVEKDLKLFSDTFKSELEKQTQKTQSLLATLLSKIPSSEARSDEKRKADSEISALKGKLRELEGSLYESLRNKMKSQKEIKRLNRSLQNLVSEKARFTSIKEKLEAEISFLKSSSESLSAQPSASSLSPAGSLAVISSSPDINSMEASSSSLAAPSLASSSSSVSSSSSSSSSSSTSTSAPSSVTTVPPADPRVSRVKDSLSTLSGSPLMTSSSGGGGLGDQCHDLTNSAGNALLMSPGMSPSGLASAALTQQLKSMKDLHDADERKIKELNEKCEKYGQDIIRLEVRVKNPDEDVIKKHPYTAGLNERLTSLGEVNKSLSETIKRGTAQFNMMLRQIRDISQEKVRMEQMLRDMKSALAASEKRAAKLEDDLKRQKELELAAQVSVPVDPALKKEEELLIKMSKDTEGSLSKLNKELQSKIELFRKEFSVISSQSSSASEVETSLKRTIEELKDQEGQLLDEVNTIGCAYEDLQAQNANLTKQINEKESAKITVLREKNKLQSTLDRMKREFDTHRAEFNSLSDEVKALKDQIAAKDNALQEYQLKLVNKIK